MTQPVTKNFHEFDIRDWGADPSIDNLPVFQQFFSDVDSSIGTCICHVPFIYPISETLLIDRPVWFVGRGRSRSGFRPSQEFGTDPVIRLAQTETVFWAGLRNLIVDAANLADIGLQIGIVQEQCGTEHVVVRNARWYGVYIRTEVGSTANRVPNNFALRDMEINFGDVTLGAAPIGLYVDGAGREGGLARGPRGVTIDKITVNSGAGELRSGIEINGNRTHVSISEAHVEDADSGLRVVNHNQTGSPRVSINSIKTNASVTATLRLQNGVSGVSAHGLWRDTGGVLVNDTDAGFISQDEFGDYSVGTGPNRLVTTTIE